MRTGWLALVLLGAAFAGCLGSTAPLDDEAEPAATDGVGGFSDTHVFDGNYTTEEAHALPLEEGPHEMLEGELVYVESPVGAESPGSAEIQIGIVRPDVPEDTRVPVVVQASPYFFGMTDADLHELRPRLTESFVPHGYAVAFLAVRGTADSGGCMDLMGPDERADLDRAITWLGEQDWSNGNVGMLGVSYDGSTPWEVAAQGNEHLETIVPISGLSDIFHLEFRNGTTEQRMTTGGVVAGYQTYSFLDNNPTNGRSAEHSLQGAVCPEAAEALAANYHSVFTGERDPTGFWEERNSRPGVEERYDGSILLVHGLQDWNVDPHHAYPWASDLEEQGFTVKHLLGQWGHAWPDGDYLDLPERRVDFAEILLHWFDRWLKEDETVDLGPPAQIQDDSGQWRSADTWPPRNTTPLELYLAPEGELAREPTDDTASVPVGPGPSLAPSSVPTLTSLCETCATFSTTVDESTRVAGQPTVHVSVTPTGPTGHLSAFLYASTDDGYKRVGWTQMDLRFHEGGETAQLVQPGETIVARMQLEPLDTVLDAGSELTLILSQGQQHDRTPALPPSPASLEVGGEQSVVTLDTFEVAEDQLFEPPG